MLAENDIFVITEAEKQLFDSRGRSGSGLLTAEAIDYEMQFQRSRTILRLRGLTQDGLEHFTRVFGESYRVLYLDDCRRITDFSPLGGLEGLEAIRIEWCRGTECLWDMSKNEALKIISIHDAKKITLNPWQLRTAPALEEVRLWGSFDNKYQLESLRCFCGMKSLKRLDLNDIRLKNRDLESLSELTALEELNFDAGMLTTEEIAWICVKYPQLHGACLGVYTKNDPSCMNDIRICGYRKPGLDLPEEQWRLDKYTDEFNMLVEKYRNEI